ncbi:MAG: L-rhamnose isomerase [Alphaproteobacteria bacterium]
MKAESINKAYDLARERYADLGVNVDEALARLERISISLHCWQADDVGGFENPDAELGGGLAVTGNYPGKARTIEEVRADLAQALSLIPGSHRVNLHSIYGDFGGGRVDRDQIEPAHYQSWVDWARERGLALDFNCTCFGHPRADAGFTLSSLDEGVRAFWIEHIKRCREIGAWIGQELGSPCVHNLWVPDGFKDETVGRYQRRDLLQDSLAEVFATEYPLEHLKDSVESKLFGIGSESFVVGSYDFYLAWAALNDTMLCLDMGHFHPTESVADKVSALLLFLDELLIHVSRGVHWDSDHVVIFGDELLGLMLEIVRADALHRVNLALDFFDASINRVAAYVIGARATQKALLFALLEPTAKLREWEKAGDYSGRLALLEECKSLPFGAVWDAYCAKMNVPAGEAWLDDVRAYEKDVLSRR